METAAKTIDLSKLYVPTEKQKEVHSAPEMYVLFGGAVGGGKSVVLVNEGIQLSIDTPNNRGFIGRWENKAFKNTTLDTLQTFLAKDLILNHHKSDQRFTLINGSEIMYGGLKPSASTDPIKRLGSLELGWIALDEAAEIPEDVFLMLCSRLRLARDNIQYRVLLGSNPEPGWLRTQFIEKSLPDHRYIQSLPRDNPHLPSDYEARLRRLYPDEWVERYLESNWDVMLEGNHIFPYKDIRAAIERDLPEDDPCEAGIDISAGSINETIAAMRWGRVVRIVYRSSHINTMQTTGELAIILDKYQPRVARMDVVGLGKGPCDRLLELNYPMEPYIGGASSIGSDADRFFNKRAQDHWHLRETLEEGNLDLPDDEKLSSQLAGIRYKTRSDKQIQLESKIEMKARGFDSPDLAEAVSMACARTKGASKKGRVYRTGIAKQVNQELETKKHFTIKKSGRVKIGSI